MGATMNPKLFWLLTAILLVGIPRAEAQQPTRVHKIGYLTPSGGPAAGYDILRQELSDLGYVDGKNIIIVQRTADESELSKLAKELLLEKIDLVVTAGGVATRAVQMANGKTPIVFTSSGDPIEAGFVDSLARPGRQLTGITWMAYELVGKRLELLKEAVSKVSHVAVVANPAHAGEKRELSETQRTARSLGMTLDYHQVRTATDFDSAFGAILKEKANGLLVFPENRTLEYRKRLAEFATGNRLPAMFGWQEYVQAGGLMAYGPNRDESFRRIAVYVDKILKGAKPADLPVEQSTKFELVINLKAAKQIGLTVPPNVLARADRVIR
jgi:putative ABC transport system substrate-binding protein